MTTSTQQKKPEQASNGTAQAKAGTAQMQGCTTKLESNQPAKGYAGNLGRFERLPLRWNGS